MHRFAFEPFRYDHRLHFRIMAWIVAGSGTVMLGLHLSIAALS